MTPASPYVLVARVLFMIKQHNQDHAAGAWGRSRTLVSARQKLSSAAWAVEVARPPARRVDSWCKLSERTVQFDVTLGDEQGAP